MTRIDAILQRRGRVQEAKAAVLARQALADLKAAGFQAWLFGSLARGQFRLSSDIDILIDAPGELKMEALGVCLDALNDFPSSIVFLNDLPPYKVPHFMEDATDEPRLRG